ncbi:MAG: hypothetical protein K0B15_11895 [Lentimicrobium sp.]|nr:hypothetical protein [Lentimicrobium sp.]
MKTKKEYKRNYVGKGKPATSFSIKFTISLEMIEKYKYEKNGIEYFSFETSKMKQADEWGRTHTAWVTTQEIVEEEIPQEVSEPELPLPKTKKTRKPRSNKAA